MSNSASWLEKIVIRLNTSRYRAVTIFNHALYPILAGLLFDLPILGQILISTVFFGATYLVKEFSEALLSLWQALAISAFAFVFLNYIFPTSFSNLLLVCCVLIIWFVLLVTKAKNQSFTYLESLQKLNFEELLILGYLSYQSPRGRREDLGFIYQEDNQRSLNAIVRGLRSSTTDLSLLSPGDTLGMPAFVKFFTNFVTKAGLFSTDAIPLHAINSLSNSWVLLLLSYFVMGGSLLRWCFKRLNQRANLIGRLFGFLSMVWSFQTSHSAGYFPLFLLNTVVISFICTYRDTSNNRIGNKLLVALSGLSLAFAMFGSWQPWLPVAGGAILFVLYKLTGRNFLIRMIFRSKAKYFVVVILILGSIKFLKILAATDLESSGREHFPTEILLVIAALIVIVATSFIHRNLQKTEYKSLESGNKFSLSTFVDASAAFVLTAVYFFDLSFNQQQTIFLILIIGLVFNRINVNDLRKSCHMLLNDENSDGPLIFGVLGFAYIALVYLFSRLVGPVYEPMYASDKASVAFYSQFFWLPIALISSQNTTITQKSFVRHTLSLAAFSGLLVTPSVITYQAVKEKWWHRPVVDSLAIKPDLPIVCSFSTEFSKDRETWVCTHFMEVLNDEKFLDLMWFQQWQNIGPRPVDLSLARKFLIEDSTMRNLLVLSCSELDDGMKDFFGLVGESRVQFIVQKPCSA